MRREELVLEIAAEQGFDLAGLAPLAPPPDARRFADWLAAGRNGSMGWLERQRERILDPRRVLPAGRSLLALGLAHSRVALELEGGGRVARYAAARDYHNAIGRRLRKLAARLQREGLVGDKRLVVDAGPLLERSHAAQAGLGFLSKAANLLHPSFGPWFFLAEILLEEELEPTGVPPAGSCGSCTACLTACPTGAIVEPGAVDARLCLSYQTIESRAPIPHPLREPLGEWAFGCDVCSEVCPWGSKAPDRGPLLGTHPAFEREGLVEWLTLEEGFDERLAGSPLRRARREGLARNAAIVLGNRPSERGKHALLRALSFDPSAMVREAAGWGLLRGHGAEADVRRRVEEAARREDEGEAQALLRRSLEEL